jgi:hypothetical protein
VYREFTRVGGEKVPDDRTMRNLARQLGLEVIEKAASADGPGQQDRHGPHPERMALTAGALGASARVVDGTPEQRSAQGGGRREPVNTFSTEMF